MHVASRGSTKENQNAEVHSSDTLSTQKIQDPFSFHLTLQAAPFMFDLIFFLSTARVQPTKSASCHEPGIIEMT